jgi:prevent-host-death family protein
MKTHADAIGAFEAKNRFSELLERVGRGAEITITKHDRPVAKLVPFGEGAGAARRTAAAELKALRKRYSLKGVTARELIDTGRR